MSEIQKFRGSLYKIDNRIKNILAHNVDEQTGEIPDTVMSELENLELTKETLTKDIALSYFDYSAFSNAIKNDPIVAEAKRRLELAKQYDNTVESLKKILTKIVPERTIVENEHFHISWRKSAYVQTDDLLSLEDVNKTHPGLIKTTLELKITEVKELNKKGLPLPNGIFIKEKQNIQIK